MYPEIFFFIYCSTYSSKQTLFSELDFMLNEFNVFFGNLIIKINNSLREISWEFSECALGTCNMSICTNGYNGFHKMCSSKSYNMEQLKGFCGVGKCFQSNCGFEKWKWVHFMIMIYGKMKISQTVAREFTQGAVPM